MKHLKVEQVHALIAEARNDRDRLLFTLLFQHGLRISEALGLMKGSVKRGYLQIQAKKKGRRADEKMNPDTLQLWNKVTECKLPHTLVFDGISRQWCSQLFHRACESAGISLQLRQGLHSLRHSLGHAMLAANCPLPTIQKALRHKSLSSTSCYLEADSASVDFWRAKSIGIARELPNRKETLPLEPAMSLPEIQEQIARLQQLALTLQPVPVAPTEEEITQ